MSDEDRLIVVVCIIITSWFFCTIVDSLKTIISHLRNRH